MHEEYDDLDELPEAPRGPGISPEDYELLSLAALAIGCEDVEAVAGEQWVHLHFSDGSTIHSWNPTRHGDDALDLAVRVGLNVKIDRERGVVLAEHSEDREVWETARSGVDLLAATCLAITRAAAEIGKLM